MRQKCSLVLSDGSRFQGDLIGAPLRASGELVFTTGMVGYSEAITDPSYYGQILCFTYPLIGNYGIPDLPSTPEISLPPGFESSKAHAAAVILTIDTPEAFHWNSFHSLDQWLEKQGVPAIIGIDTRHLVHMIRSTPNLLGRIEPEKAEGFRDMGAGEEDQPVAPTSFFDPGMTQVIDRVSTRERRLIGKGNKRVGLIDCGVKWNIVRQFNNFGCEVELLPWNTDLSTVDCDLWVLSNGPGDPTRTGSLTQNVRKLLTEERPIIGICLGHQILALAAGANTKRMPYGHRSHNQPVYEIEPEKAILRVKITATL